MVVEWGARLTKRMGARSTVLYADQALPIRESIQSSHQQALESISKSASWFTGQQRVALVNEIRAAANCDLCQRRQSAISPYLVNGQHDVVLDDLSGLGFDHNTLEVIHRISNDSGRLTKSWFDSVIDAGMCKEEYVEIVGLIATVKILDSFSKALGCNRLQPASGETIEPQKIPNKQVFDGGAWVPMFDLPQEMTDTGLPSSPNIFRALGLVPAAIEQFFVVMRSHYQLSDLDFNISRSQTELIAARVSSLNECFY